MSTFQCLRYIKKLLKCYYWDNSKNNTDSIFTILSGISIKLPLKSLVFLGVLGVALKYAGCFHVYDEYLGQYRAVYKSVI